MNLMEKYANEATALSIEQYCPPRCFELAGKTYTFAIDDGEYTGEAVLEFVDERNLNWSICSETERRPAEYECRKGDDYTYLVTYCAELDGRKENQTWVIDLEQELVTFLRCIVGENKYWPNLVDSHFGFGYIIIPGKPHTDRRRHGFTDDVLGTSVKWTYGHELATVHAYYSTNWYRITYPKDAVESDTALATNDLLNGILKELPGSDEPTFYVKIKEGMYFVSLTEQNNEKIIGSKIGFHSNTLCFLDNWKRLYSVGRGYGTADPDGEERITFVMIGKYGAPVEVDEHFFTDPNPYLV